MLQVNNIAIAFGGRTVFQDVSFVVKPGERLGIVGPNGSGKTTLLRIIAGDLPPDLGSVRADTAALALLRQGNLGHENEPVGDQFPRAFALDAAGDRLAGLAEELSRESDEEALAVLAAEYDRLVSRLADGDPDDHAALWASLALRTIDPAEPIANLSGGELTKLGLLDALAREPRVLLLDEPTNHLDIAAVEFVEDAIRRFPGAAVVVSHDRALLDAVATSILEFDPRTGRAQEFPGGYSSYADEKTRREADQWQQYRRQQREERKLKGEISAIESRSRGIENQTIHFYFRKRAKKVARRAVTLKARMERDLAASDHVERPRKPVTGFQGGFTAEEKGSHRLVAAIDATIEVGGIPLLRHLDFEVRRGERVALIGPNGAGKTTLLHAILGDICPASGELLVTTSSAIGYLAQEDEAGLLDSGGTLTPVDLLRRAQPMSVPDANNFLHRFLFGHDQLATPVARLSYGERRRLALALLVASESSLLLLDEPTNHLDIPSQEGFEAALDGFTGATLFATHDRYLVERFADRVLLVEDGRLVEM